MFALTIDQRASRTHPDRVPELLDLLASVPTRLPFERTAGDEAQGLIDSPRGVIEAIERTMQSGDWTIGLGIGPVDGPLPGSVRVARGPALVLARQAVEAAKKVSPVRLTVRRHEPAGSAAEAEALLRLVGVVLQRRTPAQWRVIDAVRGSADRAGAAHRLGITVQAISKSLITSSEDVVRDVYPLLARVLADADEWSE